MAEVSEDGTTASEVITIRVDSDGRMWAMSETDLEEGNDMDTIAVDAVAPVRDFQIRVTARPPVLEVEAEVEIKAPAASPAVVAEAVA